MAEAFIPIDLVVHAGRTVGTGRGELALCELDLTLDTGVTPSAETSHIIKVSHAGSTVLAHISWAHVHAAGVSSISIRTGTRESSQGVDTSST